MSYSLVVLCCLSANFLLRRSEGRENAQACVHPQGFDISMNFHWFKQTGGGKPGRMISLGVYNRAVSWSKYLVSSGAEIKGEGEEQCSPDMSRIFIGCRFASGRHSRVYKGTYEQRDVAIKLISQPEEDEDMSALVEKQFTSEVALLFHLHHCKNIWGLLHTMG